VNGVLTWIGVEPKRYRLLTDLFHELSERREIMGHLGDQGMSLRVAAVLFALAASLVSLVLVLARQPRSTYFAGEMAMGGLLMLCILFSETSNSLVNPVEGLVLAHYPINGATYIAAKLTHLFRVVTYLSLGFGVPGAIGGFWVKDAGTWYPVWHLAGAFAVGLLCALFCCGFFGWLVRFVPPARLKSAGQVAEFLPWLLLMFIGRAINALERVHWPAWVALPAIPRMYLWSALGTIAAAVVTVGIRSLSADYLVRVSSIVHGSAGVKVKGRWQGPGDAVERLYGPAGRAGFEYVARMITRDWQVRRQLLPVLPMTISLGGFLVEGVKHPPFSGSFTMAHLLPHTFGVMLFFLCSVLRFGSYPKAVWIFLLAPTRVLGRFALGVHAALWFSVILIPHAIMLAVLAWSWGVWQAVLFAAFSLAVASCYLGMELRLIEYVPFSRQAEVQQNFMVFGIMVVGGVIMAVMVGLQYFLLFRSAGLVAGATLALGAAAWFLTRSSLAAFEASMRFNLGLESEEVGRLYTEVG
jgi:hypothetical protein